MFLEYKKELMPYNGHLEYNESLKTIEFKTISNRSIIVQYKSIELSESEYNRIVELIRINNSNESYILNIDTLIDIAEMDNIPDNSNGDEKYPYITGIKDSYRVVSKDIFPYSSLVDDIKIIYNKDDESKIGQIEPNILFNRGNACDKYCDDFTVETDGELLTGENFSQKLGIENISPDTTYKYYMDSDIIFRNKTQTFSNIEINGNGHKIIFLGEDYNQVFDAVLTFNNNITLKNIYFECVITYAEISNSFILFNNRINKEFTANIENCVFQFTSNADKLINCIDAKNVYKLNFYRGNKFLLESDGTLNNPQYAIDCYNNEENVNFNIDDSSFIFYNNRYEFNLKSNRQFIKFNSVNPKIDINGFTFNEEYGNYIPTPFNKYGFYVIINYTTLDNDNFDKVLSTNELANLINYHGPNRYKLKYTIIDYNNNVFIKYSYLCIDGRLMYGSDEKYLDEMKDPIELHIRQRDKFNDYCIPENVYYRDYTGGINKVNSENNFPFYISHVTYLNRKLKYIHPTYKLNNKTSSLNDVNEYLNCDVYVHGNIIIETKKFKENNPIYSNDIDFNVDQFISNNILAYVQHVCKNEDNEVKIEVIKLPFNYEINPSFDVNKPGVYNISITVNDNYNGSHISNSTFEKLYSVATETPYIKLKNDLPLFTQVDRNCDLRTDVVAYEYFYNGISAEIPVSVTVYNDKNEIINIDTALTNIGRYKIKYDAVDRLDQRAISVYRELLVYGKLQYTKIDNFNLRANGDIITLPEVNVLDLLKSPEYNYEFYYYNYDNVKINVTPEVIINGINTSFINLNKIGMNKVEYTLKIKEGFSENNNSDIKVLKNNIYVHGNISITASNVVWKLSDGNITPTSIEDYIKNEVKVSYISVLNDGTLINNDIDSSTLQYELDKEFDPSKVDTYTLTLSCIDTRFEPHKDYGRIVKIAVVD